jgi:hypothetical protein
MVIRMDMIVDRYGCGMSIGANVPGTNRSVMVFAADRTCPKHRHAAAAFRRGPLVPLRHVRRLAQDTTACVEQHTWAITLDGGTYRARRGVSSRRVRDLAAQIPTQTIRFGLRRYVDARDLTAPQHHWTRHHRNAMWRRRAFLLVYLWVCWPLVVDLADGTLDTLAWWR